MPFIADAPGLRCSADVSVIRSPANLKVLIPRYRISAVVGVVGVVGSVELDPVPHPVCELLRSLRLRPVRRLRGGGGQARRSRCRGRPAAHPVLGYGPTPCVCPSCPSPGRVAGTAREWASSKLSIGRACDLTAADLEHADLGAEHFNAGGFAHDLSLARCGVRYRDILADAGPGLICMSSRNLVVGRQDGAVAGGLQLPVAARTSRPGS